MSDSDNIGSQPNELEQLISSALEHIKSLNYSRRSFNCYRQLWRELLDFSTTIGENKFSVELSEKFLHHRGILLRRPNIRLRADKRYIRTAIRILTEFSLHGCFQRRQLMPDKVTLSPTFAASLEEYVAFAKDPLRLSFRALRGRQRNITQFLHFLESRGVTAFTSIQPRHLSEFIRSQSHLSSRTINCTASNLRAYLRYLCMLGSAPSGLAEQVPKVRLRQDAHIPSVWRKEDVEALLAIVDRGSPLGKRDYAILLLAARLGLRVGDIRDLRLDNINWEKSQIEITQAKTGVPLRLPLTDEVGSAIIDYLQHGRPQTDHRVVFLRHNAPFEPFGANDNLHYIITAYRQRAGIKLPERCKRGLNALRHSIASRLLEVGTPLQDISHIMGHLSLDTTRIYTKIDIENLRRVAIDPEEMRYA